LKEAVVSSHSLSRPRHHILLGTAFALLLAAMLVIAPAAQARSAHHGKDPGKAPDSTFLFGGATVLQLDPGAVAALGDTPVTALRPARAVEGGFAFPIIVGEIEKPGSGEILHAGGLRFGTGESALRLRRFIIDLDAGVLTARVFGVGRVPILSLTLLPSAPEGAIAAAEARLTQQAAAALGNPSLEGALLGVATVRPERVCTSP
jgi:hypothetical protein